MLIYKHFLKKNIIILFSSARELSREEKIAYKSNQNLTLKMQHWLIKSMHYGFKYICFRSSIAPLESFILNIF